MTTEALPKLPIEIAVRRTDPVYNAHGYLTKVPVDAILPLIEAFTRPGDLILDPFAGSGMTGVAAVMTGRKAILSDISRLGQHIGTNYVNVIDSQILSEAAARVLKNANRSVPGLYTAMCSKCHREATLIKAIWSQEYRCEHCHQVTSHYQALKAAGWQLPLVCTHCHSTLSRLSLGRVGERLVRESVACSCSTVQLEQQPTGSPPPRFAKLERWPDVAIDADREMYRRSALGKHGLTSTARFFSRRNLTALVALREAINEEDDPRLREKLKFVFTAILPRASKRYQWSHKRPLNAQNQTYYISAVFYEWNVFDLFKRKAEAVIASDNYIRGDGPLFAPNIDVEYRIASADELGFLADDSVDYIFTDPPFGSNIFYSDMNLFQEAWLGLATDRAKEAVVATGRDSSTSLERYERLMTAALRECHRVLKPGAWFSLVFSNSRGAVWALVQRAFKASGLQIQPECLCLLDKGQRSVKGLASGFEDVVTSDLIITARKLPPGHVPQPLRAAPNGVGGSVRAILEEEDAEQSLTTPSRVYLGVIRRYLENHWDLEALHYSAVVEQLAGLGYHVDPATSRLSK